MTEYRCRAGCLSCGNFWAVRKRSTDKPPARCPKCNSSKTYIVSSFVVNGRQDADDYQNVMEKMFKEFLKTRGDVF